jgi:hypothetical protein
MSPNKSLSFLTPLKNSSPALAVAILMMGFGIFFRVIRADLAPATLPNFSPLMAAALCGAVFIPGWLGLALPVSSLLISDVLLSLHDGAAMNFSQLLWTLPCYLIAVAIGWSLRSRQVGLWQILCGTFAASVIFYVVTNTGSWLGLTAYTQTPAGWIQSMTTGLPGFPPTWTFLRNSLTGDLLFAALFVLLERTLSAKASQEKVAA